MSWLELLASFFGAAHLALLGGVFLRLGRLGGLLDGLAERVGRLEDWQQGFFTKGG